MGWKNWRWPDRGQAVLAACAAGMDASWLYLLGALFHRASSGAGFVLFSAPLLALLEWMAWLLGVLLLGTRWSERRMRGVAAGVGVAVVGLAALADDPGLRADLTTRLSNTGWFGGALLTLGLGLLLWWRGLGQAAERLKFDDLYSAFRLGVGALVAAALLGALGAVRDAQAFRGLLGPATLAFFGCGLLGLAVGNLFTSHGARPAGAEDRPAAAGPPWTFVLVFTVGAILLIGGVGSGLGLGSIVGALLRGADAVFGVLAYLLYWVVAAVLWVLFTLILDPLERFLTAVRLRQPEPPGAPPFGPPAPPHLEASRPWALPLNYEVPFKWLAACLLVALIAWLAIRALRRYRRHDLETPDLVRERVGTWGLLWQQITDWLRRHLRHRRPAAPAPHDELAGLAGLAEYAGILSVRRIYAALQAAASAAGQPRGVAQTPNEYLPGLQTAFPQAAADLAALTEAYLEARYGPPPVPAPLVSEARRRWQQVRPVLAAGGDPRHPPPDT